MLDDPDLWAIRYFGTDYSLGQRLDSLGDRGWVPAVEIQFLVCPKFS